MDALALYGDTRPGERDHYVVSRIDGTWARGTVRGYNVVLDWGPAAGLAGFVPSADGQSISVSVLVATNLEKHLREIDRYEGDGYRRETVTATVEDEAVEAYIYVSITDGDEE